MERHKSLSVWVPSDNFTEDDKLIDYFFLSKTKYGYNTEQSLGLLFHNNFNLSKAFKDLPNYTRIINWSNFEKHNFEIAFLKFGKNFEQIRKQIPNKPLKEIIGYYYLQKHKENALYTIMVEDSINKLKPWCKRHQKMNCGTSNLAKLNNEDSDDMIIKKYCSFCGVLCMDYHQTLSPICEQCYSYLRKMQESGDRLILCLPCPDKFHWMLAHKKCLSPQDMYNYQHILKLIGQGETNDEEIHTSVRTRSSYKKKNEKKNKFYKYAKCYESISPITNNCIFPQCNSAGILCPISDKSSSKVKLPFMRLNEFIYDNNH
ncbi:REST corepressor spr-1-like [Aphis gossypii]|uniref:SANT domain-containing protein n=1 Tax=Aphis gossypii TaxID=80765 RepID=A0A9P0JB08_APHGO|nr:REST corepressor spr-1-like [Aphis gossypii]CAH1733251.1 unnamed protein product [Aphis gossypii]